MDNGDVGPDFTMSDLLQELSGTFGAGKGKQDEAGLYTSKELSEFFGITRRVVRNELCRLKDEGRLDDTVRKRVSGLGVASVSVPAYRLIEKREDNDRED